MFYLGKCPLLLFKNSRTTILLMILWPPSMCVYLAIVACSPMAKNIIRDDISKVHVIQMTPVMWTSKIQRSRLLRHDVWVFYWFFPPHESSGIIVTLGKRCPQLCYVLNPAYPCVRPSTCPLEIYTYLLSYWVGKRIKSRCESIVFELHT